MVVDNGVLSMVMDFIGIGLYLIYMKDAGVRELKLIQKNHDKSTGETCSIVFDDYEFIDYRKDC